MVPDEGAGVPSSKLRAEMGVYTWLQLRSYRWH